MSRRRSRIAHTFEVHKAELAPKASGRTATVLSSVVKTSEAIGYPFG